MVAPAQEDLDYAPSEEDEETKAARKAAKKRPLRGAAAGADFEADAEADAAAARRAEYELGEDDVPSARQEAKKAKIDALWSQLSQKAAVPPKPGGGGSLAGLCKPAGAGGKGKAKGEVGGALGSAVARCALCRFSCARPAPAATRGCQPRCGVCGGPAPAGREALLLGCPPARPPTCLPCLCPCASPAAPQAWMRELGLGKPKAKPAAGGGGGGAKAVAAAALAAAKTAASVTAAAQYGKVVVTETRRFAGQDITVKKEVAAGSKEAQKAAAAAPKAAAAAAAAGGDEPSGAPAAASGDEAAAAAAAQKKSGLDAVLASLAQPKKVRGGCMRLAGAHGRDLQRGWGPVYEAAGY